MTADLGPAAVFVYGTLMPGHLRWPLLEPHAVSHRPAAVPGHLYDTGRGWPAATVDPAAATVVPGVLVRLRPEGAAEVLDVLDEVEGVAHGLYVRFAVHTVDGEAAWAWSHAGTIEAMAPITAWSGRQER